MYVFTAPTLLEEMQAHAPDVLAAVRRAVEGRQTDLDFIRLEPDAFAAAPDISIDYAVAERTARAAVVPADLGWSDVGSWDALWDISPKDATGNVSIGDVFLEHTTNCYVRSRRHRHRGDRARRRGGGGDRGCGAGDAPRPRAGREESGGPAAEGRPARGGGAQPLLPAVGLLREPDPGRPVPGEADRGDAGPEAVAAAALPPRRALGGGGRRARW